MPTRASIIKQVKEQDASFSGMSDDKIIALMQKAQPNLVIEDDSSFLETAGKETLQGIKDFSEAGVTGIDNLLTDITNLTVGKALGKEFAPIREQLIPTGEEFKGGLLRRTTGRLGEFGEQTFEGTKAETRGEQSKAESVFQIGGELGKFATGTFGDIVGTGLSTVIPDKLETKVKNLVQEGLNETNTGQWITKKMSEFENNMNFLKDNNPQAYRNYRATFGYLEAGLEAIGLKKVSGLYKAGGEIKHIPTDKLKELTQQTTTKLQEAVQKTTEIIGGKKDQTVSSVSDILGNIPKPSKEFQKAVSEFGTEFEVEKTPTLFENFNDTVFSKKNQEMAVQSVFPKQTKEKGIKARLGAGETALKGIEQLYDDKARGIVNSDINQMAGGVEGIQQGLEYWGKKIGEYTDVDTTMNFSDEIDILAKSLDEKFAKLNPDMYSIVKKVVDEFRSVGDEATIKDLQRAMSDIKSNIFSDFKITKQLASSSTGKALGTLLESLTDKFNATIDIVTGNSKQLKEAKSKYSNYLKIQKDLTDSFIVAQRNAGKGLAGTAGKLGGVYELMNNPSLSGIVKGILLKQSGELISKAKSRDGNWEMLIRNLDRKAVRNYNLKKSNGNLEDNNDITPNGGNNTTVRSNIDNDLDNQKSVISETETLNFVQDIAKQIENNIGDTDGLIEIKDAINDEINNIPKKYKDLLNEKVDAHIRDVENYKAEVDAGEPFSLTEQYGDELTKSFNRLEGIQKRTKTTKGGDKMSEVEFQTTPAYKTFSTDAQEYITQSDLNITVQELFEQMGDMKGGVRFQTKESSQLKDFTDEQLFEAGVTKSIEDAGKLRESFDAIHPNFQKSILKSIKAGGDTKISKAEDIIKASDIITSEEPIKIFRGIEQGEKGFLIDKPEGQASISGGNTFGISTTSDKNIAQDFAIGKGAGEVIEMEIKPGAKILKWKESDGFLDGISVEETRKLKELGYDAIEDLDNVNGESELRILNENIIKDLDKFQRSEIIGQGEEILQADAKKVVQKYFNPEEVGIEFVDNIITPEGLEALGKYRDKLITFSKNPLESTPEHEVLHAFFDTMVKDERKVKVLDEVKTKQEFDNDLDAEEWLADNFVNFARDRDVSGITDNVKQFFEDMLRGLKTIFFEGDVVDNLYRDLEKLSKRNGISKPKAVIIGGTTDNDDE